jgi:NOL1/NOP2/sun family putative RNA methylase
MKLPEPFIRRMNRILGNETEDFMKSLNQETRTSIRINPAKYKQIPDLEPVGYCSTGYFLPQRPLFTLDPFIHSGVYYVQEASSMFLEQAIKQIDPEKPLKVLDLSAAPGGKSTHLASLLNEDSLLVSNEVIRSRAEILSENLKKWGYPNIIVTNNDPKDFARMEGFFDVVVIDAPCSGEGLFRRDEKAIEEWSESNAHLCSQRQKRILADVWPALKEGGYLIYSTCTFNPEENEENIDWLQELDAVEPVKLTTDQFKGITETYAGEFPCYRFYPHKMKGEGFFISLIRKKGGKDSFRGKTDKKQNLSASNSDSNLALPLLNKENQAILSFEDSLLAFPKSLLNDLLLIKQYLRIVHAGIQLGQVINTTILPSHELALSRILNRNAFPEIELSYDEALRFLKIEELHLISSEKGWNLLSYRGIPVGWVKNLGNRFNSSFPKEWRIRMSLQDFSPDKLEGEKKKFPL